jgi:hypothetical protein
MNMKKLIGMIAVLLLLMIVALVQYRQNESRRPSTGTSETALFDGVDLNAVDALEVAEGPNTVTLVKRDGIWVNDSLFGYPVDFSKLAEALRTAAELKMGRPERTANIDLSEFGLDDAKIIRLNSDGETVARIEVGARREASENAGWAQQHFIRRNGAEDIYLVDYDFRPFAVEAAGWIEKELLNVPSAEVVEVKVGDVHLKQDGAEWKLSDLDEDNETFEASEASKLRMALQYLNGMSIADPAATDAELGFTNGPVYTAFTTNKTYIVTLGGESEDGRYVRFSGAIPDQLNGWTYVISSYEAGDFLMTRDQLVKAKEPESEEAPAE